MKISKLPSSRDTVRLKVTYRNLFYTPVYVAMAEKFFSEAGLDVIFKTARNAAEAMEAIAHGYQASSKVVGKAIEDIDLPEGTTIGAIVRNNEVLIAHDDTVVESDDHVILFLVDRKTIPEVERLFQVGFSFF
mgnify:CR=1 FL=1